MFFVIILTVLLLCSILLPPVINSFFDALVHKDMTISSTKMWDYGTFELFKTEFKKRQWDSRGWSTSLFDYSTDSCIHADIIKFNGKGMVLKRKDYIKFKKFMQEQTEYNNLRKVGLWKKADLKVIK